MRTACLAALFGCLFVAAVQSQPVYRCGSAYSQKPCPAGDGKVVDATDPRSAAQRAEARRVVDDQKRLAAEMRRDRIADEKAIRPAAASGLNGVKAPDQAASAPGRHVAKRKRHVTRVVPRDDFIALDPASRRRRSAP